MQQSRVSYDGHKRVSRKLEQQWAEVGAGWGPLEKVHKAAEKVKVRAATQRKHRAQQEIQKKEKNMQENKRKFDAGDVLQNQIEKQKRRRKSE